MGKLKLPDTTQSKTTAKREPAVKSESLAPGDIIDYRLTVEVDTGHGKAWVKFGGESAVREGETTDAARIRFTDWVNEEIDRRIEDLS